MRLHVLGDLGSTNQVHILGILRIPRGAEHERFRYNCTRDVIQMGRIVKVDCFLSV